MVAGCVIPALLHTRWTPLNTTNIRSVISAVACVIDAIWSPGIEILSRFNVSVVTEDVVLALEPPEVSLQADFRNNFV